MDATQAAAMQQALQTLQRQLAAVEQRAGAAEAHGTALEQRLAQQQQQQQPTVGSQPTPFASRSFLDTRLVAKPPEYASTSQWQQWSFQFRNWVGAVDAGVKQKLDEAIRAADDSDVMNVNIDPAVADMSRSMYHLHYAGAP